MCRRTVPSCDSSPSLRFVVSHVPHVCSRISEGQLQSKWLCACVPCCCAGTGQPPVQLMEDVVVGKVSSS
jgi:hypothetical protein